MTTTLQTLSVDAIFPSSASVFQRRFEIVSKSGRKRTNYAVLPVPEDVTLRTLLPSSSSSSAAAAKRAVLLLAVLVVDIQYPKNKKLFCCFFHSHLQYVLCCCQELDTVLLIIERKTPIAVPNEFMTYLDFYLLFNANVYHDEPTVTALVVSLLILTVKCKIH